MQTIRRASKADSWYPGKAEDLRQEIDACLEKGRRQFGENYADLGGLPAAVVVPHAGLFFSGSLAAVAFDYVRRSCPKVDRFVVFGACHRMRLRHPAIWSRGAWETPLGEIAIDEDLAAAFCGEGVGEANPAPHLDDNAIELQTPFIKGWFPEAKMVPVAMGFFDNAWEIGGLAAQIAGRFSGVTVAVASTDLTHYGKVFGVFPVGAGPAAVEWTHRNDNRFLQALLNMKQDDIVTVAEQDSSACGAGAAAAAAGWAGERGIRKGRMLGYTTSYEQMPQGVAEHLVGYGAVAFVV